MRRVPTQLARLAAILLPLAAALAPAPALGQPCAGLAATERLTLEPFVLAAGAEVEVASADCGPDAAALVFAVGGEKLATATLARQDDHVDVRFAFHQTRSRIDFGVKALIEAASLETLGVDRTRVSAGGGESIAAYYPYDWREAEDGPVRFGTTVVPGVEADGLFVVYDTPKLGAFAATPAEGRLQVAFPFFKEENRAGDVALSSHEVDPGWTPEMRIYFHADLARIQDARFGAPDRAAMQGAHVAQFVPRVWSPSLGVMERKELAADPMGAHCGAARRGAGRMCFATDAEMRAFAEAMPDENSYLITRLALPLARTAQAVKAGGATPIWYLFFGALHVRDSDPDVPRDHFLTDSAGEIHMAPRSHESSGNWQLLDITRREVRDYFIGRAIAALDAGYEGIFMDGAYLWNMPNGRVGGDNPQAEISHNHARHLLLQELRQAMRARDPEAKLGLLANVYTEFMQYADFLIYEGSDLHWEDATRLPHERVMAYDPDGGRQDRWQARFGRLARTPTFFACKGPNVVLVRTCRAATEAPHAGFYYDSGDWDIYDSEIAILLLEAVYGPGDFRVDRTDDGQEVLGYGMSGLAMPEAGAIRFSAAAPLLQVETWTPSPQVSHVHRFDAGARYIPAGQAGPEGWRWAREGFLYRSEDAYVAGDFYVIDPPRAAGAGAIEVGIAPTPRREIRPDTPWSADAREPDRAMTLRLALPPGGDYALETAEGAPLAAADARRSGDQTVVEIETDGPVVLRLTTR